MGRPPFCLLEFFPTPTQLLPLITKSSLPGRRDFIRLAGATSGLMVLQGPMRARSAAGIAETVPDFTEFVTLADFEAAAVSRMNGAVHAYVSGGAADEITLRRNIESYRRLLLEPRVLTDLGELDLGITLLGRRRPFPILLAPTASNRAVHPEGEIAVAQAASRTGATYVLSTSSNTAVEEVAKATSSPLWFQLYVYPDTAAAKDLIRRAEDAGCEAICITVDTPVPGLRDRQAKARFDPRAGGLTYPHLEWAQSRSPNVARSPREPQRLEWKDVEHFTKHSRVPVFLKGIMRAEDARLALEAGAAGIIVSNHGGRSLDTLPATVEVLPGIVAAVQGRAPVLVDGGIRRGTDVVKALALGATAVLIGRPYVYGLAVAGAEGVVRVLEILIEELRQSLALLGRPSVASLDASVFWKNPAGH